MTTEKPIRIQRQRTRGFRMPPNTVYVGRPSRWGNPYRAKDHNFGAYGAVALYRISLESDLARDPNMLAALRGKNLACWCRLGQPCHADVLLELANA